ncbi:unnamed protein product, partial [marine sediment metagenome]
MFKKIWNSWSNLIMAVMVIILIALGTYLGGCFTRINSNKAIINSIL